MNGVVVNGGTHAPISGATVSIAAPSGSYTAKTDGSGRFTIIGVTVDTYTVSITAAGFETSNIQGVTVQGDQPTSVGNVDLSPRATAVIGRVAARSANSAFQPTQTTDTYTVTKAQLLQSTGNPASTDLNSALLSVPGVTQTNNSTSYSSQVTIRGGAAYEVGYQLDGVPFREPFYNGNGSFGLMNGVGTVQVVEGAADATQAGVGAGVINVIPSRGTNPGSGLLDFEAGSPNRANQFSAQYGFATPDNRFSEFISYVNRNDQPYYGYTFTNQASNGNYFATQSVRTQQFVNNTFFKFGKDANQQIQVLYLNVSQVGYQGTTGAGGLYDPVTNPNALVYYPYDQTTQGLGYAVTGYSPAQYASLIGLTPGTSTTNVPITQPQQSFSNNTSFLKLQYDNNFSANTFLTVRYYNWNTLESTDDSYSLGAWQTGLQGLAAPATIGGPTVGTNFDLVHQFGSNLTVTLNGEYDIQHPIFDAYEPQIQTLSLLGTGLANQPSAADWLPGGYVYSAYCGNTPYSGTGPLPSCDPRIPTWGIGYNGSSFQNWGSGIRFQYNPTSQLHIDLGVRVEGQNQHWIAQLGGAPSTGTCVGTCYGAATGSTVPILSPFDVSNASWTNAVLHPVEAEPRGSISFQIDSSNSLRVSYGRSAIFSDAQDAGTPFHLYGLGSYANLAALPGSTCGWAATATFACKSYASQLYWAGDNEEAPDAGNALPALYSNYDASFNHLFANGLGLRITPFFKEGTDLPAAFLLNPVLGIFGIGNQGFNKTTGVELDLTTRQHEYGFSGFFAATYQNVLSTTPPFTTAENSVPLVNSASLSLGDLYRAGYVSPASFRIGGTFNFKNGLSISPQIEANIGYPYSIGNTIAGTLNDGTTLNLPQVDFGPGITGGNASLIGGAPGAAVSTNYYDPSNPGSAQNPNIAASRGTPATASNGGILSHWNLTANLTFAYKFAKKNTVGVSFNNLFGNAFINTVPSVSPWYQPVANGLSGPQTGSESCVNQVGAARGCYATAPKDTYAFTNGAYLLTNGNFTSGFPTLGPGAPMNIQVFYQKAAVKRMNMNYFKQQVACAVIASSLAACGSGSAVSPTTQANVSSNVLQFAVGTANLYGTTTALNVVTTYRQGSGSLAPGDSGSLLNSPTLTLPGAIPATVAVGTAASYDACSTITTGPSASEARTTAIASTTQNPGATAITSFGQSGGVFGLGIEPYNAQGQAGCTPAAANATGTPYQVAPYPVPLYDLSSPTNAAGADPNAFTPWGGPPAFVIANSGGLSIVGSKNYPTGTAGLSEGIDVFAGIAPVAGGAYALNVSIPANTGTVSQSSTFTLPHTLKVLGLATAPAFVPNTSGGGTFAFAMPTGATEAYIQVTDYGPGITGSVSCNGSSATAPLFYTLETTASGTVTLPSAIAPGAAPTTCTAAANTATNGATTGADQVAVQVIAFDYDLYSASYPNSSGNAAPPSILAQTSDDVTVSAATCSIAGVSCTASLPLLRARSQAMSGARPL